MARPGQNDMNPESMAFKRAGCSVSCRPRCRTFDDQLRLKSGIELWRYGCGNHVVRSGAGGATVAGALSRGPRPEQAKRLEAATAHRYGGMRRKIQLPGFAICLPWIHDYSPGAEATRTNKSGAAVSGCPDRRNGCQVSANRNLPAAPGKSPSRRFSFYFGMNRHSPKASRSPHGIGKLVLCGRVRLRVCECLT
jgi:hypothetical protein